MTEIRVTTKQTVVSMEDFTVMMNSKELFGNTEYLNL